MAQPANPGKIKTKPQARNRISVWIKEQNLQGEVKFSKYIGYDGNWGWEVKVGEQWYIMHVNSSGTVTANKF